LETRAKLIQCRAVGFLDRDDVGLMKTGSLLRPGLYGRKRRRFEEWRMSRIWLTDLQVNIAISCTVYRKRQLTGVLKDVAMTSEYKERRGAVKVVLVVLHRKDCKRLACHLLQKGIVALALQVDEGNLYADLVQTVLRYKEPKMLKTKGFWNCRLG
jgi:hypothetical protein